MTLYFNCRTHNVGGSVADPYVMQGDGTTTPPTWHAVDWPTVSAMVAGKNIVFATHGFNVSLQHGACSLGQLEPYLALGSSDIYFGVLWPGDYWLPVINYPFEGGVSMDCGRRIAAACSRYLSQAQSISFISHSLGARLVLEAVKNLDRPARVVCLTAAAINRDCLATEYWTAAQNAAQISILASREDWVLKVAFQIGDPVADAMHDDHTAFQPALGSRGPPVPALPPITSPWQIPDDANYGHGNYLPPGDSVQTAQQALADKWSKAAAFMARAFAGQVQSWP